MRIDLTGKVAVVTGAGGGLGREHALALARRGARVVVNDLGGSVGGEGQSSQAALLVVQEIEDAGGEAIANTASVTDVEQVNQMVEAAVAKWGRVDILVCNAGILRDKTFAKMELDDFRSVLEVHVMGAVNCAKAVWPHMREQGHGRIIFTTSCSGLYGGFGQSNYSTAKMALVGLMNTLALEGANYGIKVNCLSPVAGTRMVEGVVPTELLDAMPPALVSPAIIALAADGAPSKTVLCAGAGSFEVAHITLTQGIHLEKGEDVAETILARMDEISNAHDQMVPEAGSAQVDHEVAKANRAS